MGLAYDLEVDYYTGMGDYISDGIMAFAGKNPLTNIFPSGDAFSGRDGDWAFRFCGTTARGTEQSQAIFPTGEYIIRDITFINGYYVMCGSYKAYFRDLYGAGNHNYAWDGFIMTIRGYSYNLAHPFIGTVPFEYDKDTKAFTKLSETLGLSGWGFMPMRMPLDIQPGLIADAAAVAADSSVGLQSIDIAKGTEGLEVGKDVALDSSNIKIMTVGFQLVGDPVGQGMVYTNIDYIPFMWNSQLMMYLNPINAEAARTQQVSGYPYVGGDLNGALYDGSNGKDPLVGDIIEYEIVQSATLQTSWSAQTNYTLSPPLGQPACKGTRTVNLQDWIGVSELNAAGNALWLVDDWEKGYKSDGTDYFGVRPNLPNNSSALNWGTLPRRFYGVTTYSKQQQFGGTAFSADGAFQIVGDAYLGGDPSAATPVTTATVPTQIGGVYDNGFLSQDFCTTPVGDKSRLGPFMMMHNAGVSFQEAAVGGDNEWFYQGNYTDVNLFNGAYCSKVLIPYELMTQNPQTQDPSQRAPLRHYFVNGVKGTVSGTQGCAIFTSDEIPQSPACNQVGLIAPTLTPDPTASGYPEIDLSKWYSTVNQSRTFTEEEENFAKILNYVESNVAPFGGQQEPITVRNANSGENVGVFGNYQRLGLDSDPDGTVASTQQQGNNSRQGFGALSQTQDSTPNEPIVYMFDSGRGWTKNAAYPPDNPNFASPDNYSNVILNVGANFNDKIVVGDNSATRKAIWGGWDNDRDQWLYLFSDTTTGIGVVSASSTFNPSSNDDGYLDQTDNFTTLTTDVATFKTALWNPFLMTNELDGIVIMGSGNRDNSSESIFGYTGDGANNPYWVYGYAPTLTTQSVPYDNWGGSPFTTTTIEKAVSKALVFIIKGTTGREAAVWVDYILFDGADALIATKLRERGMKVTIDAVEWFKRKIINSGDLNIKQEEIEEWMRQQQDEFQMMMRDAERMGRVRKRKKQVSAFGLDILDSISTDFEDKEVQEFMKEYLPKSRPPTPEEQMIERQRKGGYSPQTKSYYDEVFEN